MASPGHNELIWYQQGYFLEPIQFSHIMVLTFTALNGAYVKQVLTTRWHGPASAQEPPMLEASFSSENATGIRF